MSAREPGSAVLTTQDVRIIRQCLRAALEGPFFPDWEFYTLIGADGAEVAELLSESDEKLLSSRVVASVLVNLTGYPHGLDGGSGWGAWIDATPEKVDSIRAKLGKHARLAVTIYVYLLDEGTSSWRPVEAEDLGEGVFRILSRNVDPDIENWEFSEGSVVRCVERTFSGGETGLVAIEEFNDRNDCTDTSAPSS